MFIICFIAAKQKSYLRAGLKDVQSRIRKGESGLVYAFIFYTIIIYK